MLELKTINLTLGKFPYLHRQRTDRFEDFFVSFFFIFFFLRSLLLLCGSWCYYYGKHDVNAEWERRCIHHRHTSM